MFLITFLLGASSGIGLATTRLFAAHGTQIVATDINPLPEKISNVTFKKTNLLIWAEQVELFAFTVRQFGRLDIAFLNAGIREDKEVFVNTYNENGVLAEPVYKVLKIDLIAHINRTKLAIHHMRRQEGGGAIVITGSGKYTLRAVASIILSCESVSD